MLTTGFSVQGASLKLLRSHERAVITRINTLRDATTQRLRQLGLTPGQPITVEQRFPRFIVRVGNDRHVLDDTAISAIYVRIVDR
jgi:ferrous iron transport protein A